MKIAELFDELLELSVAYPRTLVLLLFAPQRLFAEATKFSRCSPGAFVAITFIGMYFLTHVIDSPLAKETKLPDWLKPEYALALVFAGVAVLSNIQAAALSKFFPELRPWTTKKTGVLSYAYSVCIVSYGAFVLIHDNWRFAYAPGFSNLLYLWLLYAISRFSYKLPLLRAVFAAVVAYFCFAFLAIAIALPKFFQLLSGA